MSSGYTVSAGRRLATIALFRTTFLPLIKAGWRPRISGSRLPGDQACFIYGNHSNRYDPFVLNCFTQWGSPTGGIMTREFFRKRFLAWALGGLDIHASKKRITEPSIVRTVYQLIERERKIVIYPTGGSRWTGAPEPWIESTAKVFLRTQLPIYPVITHGSYATWPRWADYPRPGRIRIEVGEPIILDPDTPVTRAVQLYEQAAHIDESLPDQSIAPRWAYKPASGIERILYRDPDTGRHDQIYSPDGCRVQNINGTIRLRMRPDSTLVDEQTGDTSTIQEWYTKLVNMPCEEQPGGLKLENEVHLHTEDTFPNLVDGGRCEAQLFADHISLLTESGAINVDFEDIVAYQIERNYKLQISTNDKMYQLSFVHGGSALGWKDSMDRIQAGSS